MYFMLYFILRPSAPQHTTCTLAYLRVFIPPVLLEATSPRCIEFYIIFAPQSFLHRQYHVSVNDATYNGG